MVGPQLGISTTIRSQMVPGTTGAQIQEPKEDADGKFPCPRCDKTYLHKPLALLWSGESFSSSAASVLIIVCGRAYVR